MVITRNRNILKAHITKDCPRRINDNYILWKNEFDIRETCKRLNISAQTITIIDKYIKGDHPSIHN